MRVLKPSAALLQLMASVDDLRHRESVFRAIVDEELGEHELRAQLQAYYDKHGLMVTDEILDTAIAEKKAKRFCFVPADSAKRLFAHWYVDRFKHFRRASISLCLVTLFWGYTEGMRLYEEHTERLEEKNIASMLSELRRDEKDVDEMRALLLRQNPLPELFSTWESAQVRTLQDRLTLFNDWLLKTEKALDVSASASDDEFFIPADSELRDVARVRELEDDYDSIFEDIIAYINQRRALHGQYLAAIAQRKTASEFRSTDAMQAKAKIVIEQIFASLAKGNQIDAQSLSRSFDAIIQEGGVIQNQIDRLPTVLSSLEELAVGDEAKEKVAQLVNQLHASLNTTSGQELSQISDDVDKLKGRLLITYELHIHTGTHASVFWRRLRNSEDPMAKAYYVVVEAHNDRGELLAIPVKNQETGELKTVHTFAIQVTKQQFDKVSNDKIEDGVVSQTFAGEKKLGRLHESWNLDVAGGYITEW